MTFDFYTIVIICAIILLIISLATIGVIIVNGKSSIVFPSTKNSCPDYWTLSNDKKTCQAPSNRVNMGYPTVPSTYTIDTDTCKNFKWAFDNKILWDGVSNINNCKLT